MCLVKLATFCFSHVKKSWPVFFRSHWIYFVIWNDVTVFGDKRIVKTVSTCFSKPQKEVENVNEPKTSECISENGALALMNLPKTDLSCIAKRMNLPSSKDEKYSFY